MKRWLRFNAIGIAGAAVQLTALKLLSVVGVHYLIATALAVEAAVLHNFFWHCRWTWKETGGSLLRFHLANANALTPHLDGEPLLASIGGPGSYISPNWYADPVAHVPTWNYRTVEIEGVVTKLGWDDLGDLLDLSAATFEPRVGENWTMDKMAPARRDAMMGAITAFELAPSVIRTTDKHSQNRNEADARGVVAALERIGDTSGAYEIRRTRGW